MLADRPKWRPGEILRVLCSVELQREILTIFLAQGRKNDVLSLERCLAGVMHFRLATVQALSGERKTAYVRALAGRPELQETLRKLLTWFHLEKRAPLLSAFLDYWEIPHEQGQIQGSDVRPPTSQRAAEAASALQSRFSREQVAVYFATAGLVMGPAWQEILWPLVPELAGDRLPDIPEPAESGEQQERPPEDAPQFTTLDNVVIRSVVAALSKVEGAMTLDQADDLVEEVIHLSPDRHRSFFHRGFLQTLSGQEPDLAFQEGNASRRGWLLAGRVMALARKGERERIRVLFREHRQEFLELMNTPAAVPAAVMITSSIFEALWEAQAYSEAAQAVAGPIAARVGPAFLRRLLQAGRDLLLSHRTPEATLVFELLEEAVSDLHDEDEAPQHFLYELARRQAQLLRARGHFVDAEREFNGIALKYGRLGSAEMLADIALCHGSFKWLSDVEVPRDGTACPDMIARLDTAADKAKGALAAREGFKTNAQYILGVRALLGGDKEEARALLEESYAGMSRRAELYPDVLARCRLYYALAILRSMHEPQFTIARETLQQVGADTTITDWPLWLLKDALDVLHLAPAEDVALAEWVSVRFPQLLDSFLHNAELTGRSEGLLAALKARASNPQRQTELRWQDYSVLFSCARVRGDIQEARNTLDCLEDLTFLSPTLRERFSDFLANEANYDPVWSWEEAQVARAQVLEVSGRYQDAAAILASLIHHSISGGEIEPARGLYERLKGYGKACSRFPEVEARIEELREEKQAGPTAAPFVLPRGDPLRILFIGGNETQARYADTIVEELRSAFPRATVTFLYTGWSSNWGSHLERIKQLMPEHDAAVIMRFVRTELGRAARDVIGRFRKRWFTCTGHGRDSIVRAIVAAAQQVTADRAAM